MIRKLESNQTIMGIFALLLLLTTSFSGMFLIFYFFCELLNLMTGNISTGADTVGNIFTFAQIVVLLDSIYLGIHHNFCRRYLR